MPHATLSDDQIHRLNEIGSTLIDQSRAKIIVEPQSRSTGFWFGGGNVTQDSQGKLWLVGRYRNQGDSRTGLHAGERGLELAIFKSDDQGESFQKVLSLTKAELSLEQREVLSIEGAAIQFTEAGVELFVSTEKAGINYPENLQDYLKPGTGVWTIDLLRAENVESLAQANPCTVVETSDPRFIHIKDPFLANHRGTPSLLFCSHPFCWTSSNTGIVPLSSPSIDLKQISYDFFPRGFTWDVAMTRGTSVLPLPSAGVIADQEVSLFFYDGGECVRNLEEHSSAKKRPRGYSCEELGGLAYCLEGDLMHPNRLSNLQPSFTSPHGTGCSRYVDVHDAGEHYYATWQQSQADRSQPLVLNRVKKEQILAILK